MAVICQVSCKKDNEADVEKADDEKIEVSSISLDKDILNMLAGNTYKLTATVTPEDATEKTVTWKSGDESIATVEQDGLVTAVGEGEVMISATAGTCRDECKVIVEDVRLGFYKTEGVIGLGDRLRLRPYISSTFDPDWSQLTITSDNPEAVEVAEDLSIVGKAQGKATVTASYAYSSERVLESEFRIEVEDGFLTFVDDVYTIPTRGVVASSTIYAGSVSVGDKVNVVRAKKGADDLELTVSGIEVSKKKVTTAYKDDNAAILFGDSSITKDDLPRGSIIMSPQAKRLQRANMIYGTVVITGKESVAKGYIVLLSFNGIELNAKIADLREYGTINKGETYYNIGFEITGGDSLPCFLGGEIKLMVSTTEIGKLIVSDLEQRAESATSKK